jgi:hypothetical protein
MCKVYINKIKILRILIMLKDYRRIHVQRSKNVKERGKERCQQTPTL